MTNSNSTLIANRGITIGSFTLTPRMISFFILVIAIGVSGYLTYEKYTDANAPCIDSGKFDCSLVLNSAYSEISGVPIAILGFTMNWVMVALLLLEPRIEFFRINAVMLVFGVSLFVFIYSVYLVYLQAQVIKAYCPWCLSHEALLTLLFITSSARLWQALKRN